MDSSYDRLLVPSTVETASGATANSAATSAEEKDVRKCLLEAHWTEQLTCHASARGTSGRIRTGLAGPATSQLAWRLRTRHASSYLEGYLPASSRLDYGLEQAASRMQMQLAGRLP